MHNLIVYIHSVYTLCVQDGITVENVDMSLSSLQEALSLATDPEDQSSVNLATIASVFRSVAEEPNISVSRAALESATNIMADILNWDTDNSTVERLQNQSAEYGRILSL